MRRRWGTPKRRPLSGAISAVALSTADAWSVPAAQADEHRERRWHEHEFREHEFHDQRYLDHRYHRDHYYPPIGFAFGALPPGLCRDQLSRRSANAFTFSFTSCSFPSALQSHHDVQAGDSAIGSR